MSRISQEKLKKKEAEERAGRFVFGQGLMVRALKSLPFGELLVWTLMRWLVGPKLKVVPQGLSPGSQNSSMSSEVFWRLF